MNPITRHRIFTPSRKQLAAALGCSVGYISALRIQGMPQLCTVEEARQWLAANPSATFSKAYRPIKYATYAPPLKFAKAQPDA